MIWFTDQHVVGHRPSSPEPSTRSDLGLWVRSWYPWFPNTQVRRLLPKWSLSRQRRLSGAKVQAEWRHLSQDRGNCAHTLQPLHGLWGGPILGMCLRPAKWIRKHHFACLRHQVLCHVLRGTNELQNHPLSLRRIQTHHRSWHRESNSDTIQLIAGRLFSNIICFFSSLCGGLEIAWIGISVYKSSDDGTYSKYT